MSFKRAIVVAFLALAALGLGATALLLGGVGLACVGLARLALRRGRQAENAVLPPALTGRALQRLRPPGEDDAGPDIVVKHNRP